jgi:hypothetical protein
MATVLESLTNFFKNVAAQHNAPELIARWSPDLETQVNVAVDNGEPVDGQRHTYSDGIEKWFNIRIPKGAADNPVWKDYELQWVLDKHVEAIGTTGWDWVNRRSLCVGFDFDSISDHAKGVGITDDQLAKVREHVSNIDYIETRRSTGGNGLHLRAWFKTGDDEIKTANHAEHAALARCVLAMLTTETGFDFAQHIDVCGGNMWLWHRKMTTDNEGLSLIKPATKCLGLGDLPTNWRDHLDVVLGKTRKVKIAGVDGSGDGQAFDKLSTSRKLIPLDDGHKKLLQTLADSGQYCVWLHDHHLLQTHTLALQKVFDERLFPVKGVFRTSSKGTTDLNCFCFPLPDGAWKVVRFGSGGVAEHRTWAQRPGTFTYCYFNRPATVKTACYAFDGNLDPDIKQHDEFVFTSYENAVSAVRALGESFDLPVAMRGRTIRVYKSTNDILAIKIPLEKSDQETELPGWVNKKSYWVRGLSVIADAPTNGELLMDYDSLVRALITIKNEGSGWVHRSDKDTWIYRSKDDIKNLLVSQGCDDEQAKRILGSCVYSPWKVVNVPFQPEYTGNREWNRDSAQLIYQPAILDYDEQPSHPHWDMIMAHCGADLDRAIADLDWAKRVGIINGKDYLTAWVAALVRAPFQPLPYLFFYGPQDSGKSSFHEAISYIMRGGVIRADKALTNKTEFNGEIANAVLCVIEERDLAKTPGAYNRVKDWTVGKTISIRKMHTNAYDQPNIAHFVQCANSLANMPLEPGDTRVVVSYVPKPKIDIPKQTMETFLREEAPHFLRTLHDMELPPLMGRYSLPVVTNDSKRHMEELNRNDFEAFLAECCDRAPTNEYLEFKEIFETFHKWLLDERKGDWSRKKTSMALPAHFERDRGAHNVLLVRGVTWKKDRPMEQRV